MTNDNGSSVTEINASNGSLARTLSAGFYGFSSPDAVAFGGKHIWVAGSTSAVTELTAADGSWLRTASGGLFGLGGPAGLAVDGIRVWVANAAANTVTELPPG